MTELAVQKPRDTATAWTAANPILADGETGLEKDTRKTKTGDGTTPWNSLPYDHQVPVNTYVRVTEGPLSLMDSRVGGVQDNSMSSTVDNAAALNTAYTMLTGKGGEIFVPRGVYPFRTAPNPQPGGVWLTGEGYDYSTALTPRPERGSVFRALASMAHLVRLGSATGLSPGITGASMRGMALDGNGLASATLKAMGSRSRISHSQVYSGADQAYYCAGQNVHAENCIFAQDDNGDVIFVAPGSNVIDNKIWTSQVRSPGATGAGIRIQSNAVDVQMCHLWAGGGGAAKAAQGLIVLEQGVGLTLITDNTIEGVLGPEIVFDGSNGVIYGTQVVGNKFYMNTGTPDLTHPVILFKAGGYSTFSIAGNMANANDATHRYKSFFDFEAGVTALGGFVVGDNVGRFVAALLSGVLPSATVLGGIDWSNNQMHNGTGWKRTNNKGVATLTGDGTNTVFTIPHGLITTPAEAIVTAGSPAAAAPSYTVWDATNLIVTFTTAPAVGATVKLNWRADV